MNVRSHTLPARSRIYRYLYRSRDFCSRQTLSDALDLSMPTIYQNLNALMEEGLVGYSGEYRATGGRKASGLTVIQDVKFAIGIYITRSEFQLVAVDLLLNVIASQTIECRNAREYIRSGRSVRDRLEQFLDDFRLDREKLLGVGICLPAILEEDGMILIKGPTLQLENISLTGIVQDVPYPVHIENNGTCGGNAEIFFRGAQRNLAYLFLEDGVGGMLHINGNAYNGDHNRSGEFGHMCVHPGGLRCNCGKRGCLEAYCSNYRISSRLGITLEQFFDGLSAHNPEYTLLWDDYLMHLAIGITSLHTVLDCDMVLGGYMVRYLRPYFPLLQEYLASAQLMPDDTSFLHLGVIDEYPAPRGAALHFIRQFVENI